MIKMLSWVMVAILFFIFIQFDLYNMLVHVN